MSGYILQLIWPEEFKFLVVRSCKSYIFNVLSSLQTGLFFILKNFCQKCTDFKIFISICLLQLIFFKGCKTFILRDFRCKLKLLETKNSLTTNQCFNWTSDFDKIAAKHCLQTKVIFHQSNNVFPNTYFIKLFLKKFLLPHLPKLLWLTNEVTVDSSNHYGINMEVLCFNRTIQHQVKLAVILGSGFINISHCAIFFILIFTI